MNSLDTFTLIFNEKVDLEQRQAELIDRIAFFEKREARLLRGVVRPWRTARLERVQELLASANEELEFINDALIDYEGYERPRDTFNFEVETSTLPNGKPFGEATLTIDDSLFDTTYEYGDPITIRSSAMGKRTRNGTRSWHSTTRYGIPEPVVEDGLITVNFGSSKLGEMLTDGYEKFQFKLLDEDRNVFYKQEIDLTSIA